jgi:hypothetical protein
VRRLIHAFIVAVTVCAPFSSALAQGSPTAGAYDSIVVGQLRDAATGNARISGDTPQQVDDAREAYRADLAVALENFQQLLIQELKRTNVFSAVVPIGTSVTGRSLLIDGEVTQFNRGNVTTRLFLGMGAGRVQFDATIRISDASTGQALTTIDIGRGSGILGGAVGSAITVEYYMQRSAMKVAADLRGQRCAVIVCTEPSPLTVEATEDADAVAKEFDVGPDECRIYFYVSLPRTTGDRPGVEVWVDGTGEGVMDTEEGYFVWSLDPGSHSVEARYLSASLRRSAAIECVGGDAVFVHHEVEGMMIERLVLESASEGQRDLRRRRLLLVPLAD